MSRDRLPLPYLHSAVLPAPLIWANLMTRGNLSPPFSHSLACPSQRYVPVFLRRVFVALVFQHIQSLDQLAAGVAGADDGVEVSALGGDVGIGEAVAELLDLGGALGLGVVGLLELAAVDDVDRAFRAHHGDFGGGPGIVDVGADVLGGHDAIGSAIGLAGD